MLCAKAQLHAFQFNMGTYLIELKMMSQIYQNIIYWEILKSVAHIPIKQQGYIVSLSMVFFKLGWNAYNYFPQIEFDIVFASLSLLLGFETLWC